MDLTKYAIGTLTNKGRFQKGNIPWNKGKPHSDETKRKIRKAVANKKLTDEHKRKIGIFFKGGKLSETHKKNIGLGNKGKKKPTVSIRMKENNPMKNPEIRAKVTKKIIENGSLKGRNNPNWRGGISFEPYGMEFTWELKEQIRKRDNYRCQECFRHQEELKKSLFVHHIDYNKRNTNPNNLISLCNSCHTQTNYSREDWTGYFQERLKNG